jgi:hypothetical protein
VEGAIYTFVHSRVQRHSDSSGVRTGRRSWCSSQPTLADEWNSDPRALAVRVVSRAEKLAQVCLLKTAVDAKQIGSSQIGWLQLIKAESVSSVFMTNS